MNSNSVSPTMHIMESLEFQAQVVSEEVIRMDKPISGVVRKHMELFVYTSNSPTKICSYTWIVHFPQHPAREAVNKATGCHTNN
jgi:hypothetical protein